MNRDEIPEDVWIKDGHGFALQVKHVQRRKKGEPDGTYVIANVNLLCPWEGGELPAEGSDAHKAILARENPAFRCYCFMEWDQSAGEWHRKLGKTCQLREWIENVGWQDFLEDSLYRRLPATGEWQTLGRFDWCMWGSDPDNAEPQVRPADGP